MKHTRSKYVKSHSKSRRYRRGRSRRGHSRHGRSKPAYHRRKYKTRRRTKQIGGSNGLVQLGYNATRGMTSTITNFINTYIGNTPTASPQATKSQYHHSI